jgi:hypothetical protein
MSERVENNRKMNGKMFCDPDKQSNSNSEKTKFNATTSCYTENSKQGQNERKLQRKKN